MADPWRYDGKRVVVVGCYSGMGEATARELLRLGAEVHAVDIRKPELPVASYTEADLGDRRAIARAADAIGGPVHALFNCAGLPNGTFTGQQVIRVNFVGLREVTERFLPHMPAGSAVASISSAAGLGWMQNLANVNALLATRGFDAAVEWCEAHPQVVNEGYSLSKQCIIAWTMSQGVELAKRGVRINSTSPGPTDTPMMPHFERAVGKAFMDRFPRPLGRNARAEEQAYPLVFLNSDAASYITGENVMTDGGFAGGMLTGRISPAALGGTAPAD